jgi:DNA topoisomerase-1
MKDTKKKSKVTKLLTTTSLNDVVQINKWWEKPIDEENDKNSEDEEAGKWKHMEHNGVLFPAEYEPHNIKIKYKGEPIDLNPEQEEVVTFWAQVLDTDFAKKEITIRNFTKELRKVLPEKYKNASLSDFDFTAIKEYLDKKREKNKNKTTEEKKADKEKRQKLMDYYGWALVDGSCEKMANFLVEPPGLFRGRGEQPLSGTIKKRIYAEDITLNVGDDEPVPICTQPGHCWGEIVNNNEGTWLAYYKVRKNTKYVFLSSSSKFKGMSDYKKYEKAKKLKNCIDIIRKDYYQKLEDKDPENRQLGVATYLIDRLALRVGNEKGEDEADTVGCCTLRVEHIKFEDNNVITFDFLAKDSMQYHNTVEIDEIVYENLKKMTKGKDKSQDLFDLINASKLNDYLKQLMDGLSAKVFRTYNASFVLQQQLNKKEFNLNDDINKKITYYNEANRQVAIMCNHQRTVPKTYTVKSEQMTLALNENKKYLEELRDYVKNFKKSKNKYKDSKTDIIKKVFPANKEKAEAALKKLEEKVENMSSKLKERESNKTVALGTSKLNYMDPRITVSWCKKNEVNIEKIFSKSTRDKFPWAMYTGPDYNF